MVFRIIYFHFWKASLLYTFLEETTLDVVVASYLLTMRILMRIIIGKRRIQLPTMYAIPGNPDSLDRGVNIELKTSAPDKNY